MADLYIQDTFNKNSKASNFILWGLNIPFYLLWSHSLVLSKAADSTTFSRVMLSRAALSIFNLIEGSQFKENPTNDRFTQSTDIIITHHVPKYAGSRLCCVQSFHNFSHFNVGLHVSCCLLSLLWKLILISPQTFSFASPRFSAEQSLASDWGVEAIWGKF